MATTKPPANDAKSDVGECFLTGKHLHQAVALMKPHAGMKSSINVLRAAHVTIGISTCRFHVTDMNGWFIHTVSTISGGGKTKQGRFVVDLKRLEEVAKVFKNEMKVHLEIGGTNGDRLIVEGSMRSIAIPTIPEADYPHLPHDERVDQTAVFDRDTFQRALDYVVPAIANDETRPVLNALCLHKNGDLVCLQATDSYRMHAQALLMDSGSLEDGDYLITRELAVNLQKQLKKLPVGFVVVKMVHYENIPYVRIHVQNSDTIFLGRWVDGQFPNVDRLVPPAEDYKLYVTMPSDELTSAVQAIYKVAGKGKQYSKSPVHLKVVNKGDKQGEVTLSYQDDMQIGPMKASIYLTEALESGDDTFEIGFNPQFLAEAIDSEKHVGLAMISPLRPLRVNPDCDMGKLGLVMPIRINE